MKAVVVAAPVVALLASCGGESGSSADFSQQMQRARCASIAAEYRSALDAATVCDASAPACVAGGTTFDTAIPGVAVGPSGVPDVLCYCAPGPSVTVAGKASLDPLVARYRAAGCSGACPCPAPPPEGSTYTAICAPTPTGPRCTLQYGGTR